MASARARKHVARLKHVRGYTDNSGVALADGINHCTSPPVTASSVHSRGWPIDDGQATAFAPLHASLPLHNIARRLRREDNNLLSWA